MFTPKASTKSVTELRKALYFDYITNKKHQQSEFFALSLLLSPNYQKKRNQWENRKQYCWKQPRVFLFCFCLTLSEYKNHRFCFFFFWRNQCTLPNFKRVASGHIELKLFGRLLGFFLVFDAGWWHFFFRQKQILPFWIWCFLLFWSPCSDDFEECGGVRTLFSSVAFSLFILLLPNPLFFHK